MHCDSNCADNADKKCRCRLENGFAACCDCHCNNGRCYEGINPFACCPSGCFPATAKTNLKNGKTVAMSELKIGDQVKTGVEQILPLSVTIWTLYQTNIIKSFWRKMLID